MADNISYWEQKLLFDEQDVIIVGSGIVGLMCALQIKQQNSKTKVLLVERGLLPDGASTKNAGFACFGSAGELLNDLETTDADTVWETVKMRFEGLALLRKKLGDEAIGYEPLGGYEVFTDLQEFEKICDQLSGLNREMLNTIGKSCYKSTISNDFGLNPCTRLIKNTEEGQLDTARLMQTLWLHANAAGVVCLFGTEVKSISSAHDGVEIESNWGLHKAKKCVVATNAFASQMFPTLNLKPGRAQVLVTKPIPHLALKGSFHYDQGYYYFRNIDNRILFGGGRNLDFVAETTYENGTSTLIQSKLEEMLKTLILPGQIFEIERRWSGIMGLGSEKKPIIEFVSPHCLIAVRMGGMGIAIGSLVGKKAAEMVLNS